MRVCLRHIGLSLLLLGNAACGLQAGAAAHYPAKLPFPYAATVGARVHSPTGSGMFAGGHLTLARPQSQTLAAAASPRLPAPASSSVKFGLRSMILTSGYKLPADPLGFEFGLESGVGEPALRSLDNTAFYVGGSAASLVRLFGDQDHEPGFAPLAVLVDTVVTLRGGVWLPFEGASSVGALPNVTAQLAFRVTVISDLLNASAGGLEQ